MCTTTSGMQQLLNKTSVKQARPSGGGLKFQLFETLGQGIFTQPMQLSKAVLKPESQEGQECSSWAGEMAQPLKTRLTTKPSLVLSTLRKVEKGRQKEKEKGGENVHQL